MAIMGKHGKHVLGPLMNSTKSASPITDSSGLLTNEDDL